MAVKVTGLPTVAAGRPYVAAVRFVLLAASFFRTPPSLLPVLLCFVPG